MIRKGSTTSIVIATIAGLSVLGVAGYRMMSGDCGACAVTGTEAAVQSVATEGDSCCPLKGASESTATLVSTEAGDSCSAAMTCSGEIKEASACESTCSGEGAEVEMISTTSEAECGTECAGEAACGTDAKECCGKCEKAQELAKAPQ